MSFLIKHGLFKLDITDYHAILGLPIDAEPKEIRQQSLKIVQRLHPDTCKAETTEEKGKANQLLSKLVNPAYQSLYQDKSRAEHNLLLKQMAKRLASEAKKISVASEAAKKLYQAGDKLEIVYRKLVQQLAQEQYKSLDQVIIKIAELSEINLVYLYIKQSQESEAMSTLKAPSKEVKAQGQVESQQKVNNPAENISVPEPPAEEPVKISPMESYIRRAEEYIQKNKFNEAILELRDAIKVDPKNSTCQTLMGKVYLKQNQLGMAKVYINKALELNPQDQLAIEAKKELDKLSPPEKKDKNAAPKSKILEILFKKL